MDYLGREAAPFSEDLWRRIDDAVTSAASETLVARRFLPFFGPVGPGLGIIGINAPGRTEIFKDGFSTMEGRRLAQVPQLYEDFWLFWRDLEQTARAGLPEEISAARTAAQNLARREDQMIFNGVKELGLDGILTVKGAGVQTRGDWQAGEDAFKDVAAAIAALQKKGRHGQYVVATSPDLFTALHRIQPGAGLLELERVKSLVGGRLFMSAVLEPNTAFMLCAQPQYIDLAVGQDIKTAYAELVDLNHHLRIVETAILRIKAPDAIVIFK
ncbi:MAG: bacteriocin family protein [Candidatus Adiutrix sp.]|jgi:uncharacterized linocin/CFP29 family protein|nr:bacteriocin family protein [Candidatus Adiutrix sp.]